MSIKIDQNGQRYDWISPGARLDYAFDWRDAGDPWLEADETIEASEWACTSPGVVLDLDQVTAGHLTSVFVTVPDAVGQKHVVVNTITTSAGRIDSRSITLHVRQL